MLSVVFFFSLNVKSALSNSSQFVLFVFLWLHLTACGISVPQPGTEPIPSAVKAES